MTPSSSRQLVLGATAITTAVSATAAIADPKGGRFPPVSIFIGGALVAFTLSAASGYVPELSAMFAALILVGTFVKHGGGLARTLTRLTTTNRATGQAGIALGPT